MPNLEDHQMIACAQHNLTELETALEALQSLHDLGDGYLRSVEVLEKHTKILIGATRRHKLDAEIARLTKQREALDS